MNAATDQAHTQAAPARPTDPATRFPLLPRPKPPGRPLTLRVAEVHDLALAAVDGHPDDERLTNAAEAFNKAALIASDCGLPDLARQWCWQQFDRFAAVAPLTAKAAKLALQPIVNLGRLASRNGDGDGAYEIYETAYHALNSQESVMINGRQVDLGHLATTTQDRQVLRKFLWTVLLADGTRALTQAGRWQDALQHIEHHKGLGRRMLDGRQVVILARSGLGHTDTALAMLDDSTPVEPWEEAVLTCLRTLCLRSANRTADTSSAMMVTAYLCLPAQPEHIAFRSRLGLAVVDLAVIPAHRAQVAGQVIREALSIADANVASEVLGFAPCRSAMTTADARVLSSVVRESGFRQGMMPVELLHNLQASIAMSSEQLDVLLAAQYRSRC
ncbi:hypothetical protein [Umezawaea sp. Da 62-37]|uniref:hypothetical protein n=1 Tax=Umezawaea sp. Da 62-37 TaxID=3075927 RepID=UPI0028F74B6E|nr:hypothetical protein [Umezawaea sp. Da 62-37]WNV90242.1 hypothetical protein RM788_18730 [Umezawaea sp. Da 62-37]